MDELLYEVYKKRLLQSLNDVPIIPKPLFSSSESPSSNLKDSVTCGNSTMNEERVNLNFQQAEEDVLLQLAAARRISARVAAINNPMLISRRSEAGFCHSISKAEAVSFKYWVNNCLSYDDVIEDGFYEVVGMSPHVWSMCTNSDDLGCMPPLHLLCNTPPDEATFEVVLVDINADPDLLNLVDKAVQLTYRSKFTDVAFRLGKLVAGFMGGAVEQEEDLVHQWKSNYKALVRNSGIILPIGMIKKGLPRHRALLFKVLADRIGLTCRLMRGSFFMSENDAIVVVKSGNGRELMVDLLGKPGVLMPPDARIIVPPSVIASSVRYCPPQPSIDELESYRYLERKLKNVPMKSADALPSSERSAQEITTRRVVDVEGLDRKHAEFEIKNNRKKVQETAGHNDLIDGLLMQTAPPLPHCCETNVELMIKNDLSLLGLQRDIQIDSNEGLDEQHSLDGASDVDADLVPSATKAEVAPVAEFKRSLEWRSYMDDCEIRWEDIVFGDRVGQGSYGKVYRADWQGSDVAVKVFLDQDIKAAALEDFKREVAIIRRLRHPSIVLFMGAVTVPPNLSIVTEYCVRGSLFKLLRNPTRELDERRRLRMAFDVAKGMNYLHKCNPPIVHRDLKSQNLLVDRNWNVKVCDFGFSRAKHHTFLTSKSSVGTTEWMAPEVMCNEPSDEKCDVYSFGVILWELATMEQPWVGMSCIQVIGAVAVQNRRLSIPDNVDPLIAEIVQSCWHSDPKMRPSFAAILHQLKSLKRPSLTMQSAVQNQSVV